MPEFASPPKYLSCLTFENKFWLQMGMIFTVNCSNSLSYESESNFRVCSDCEKSGSEVTRADVRMRKSLR